MRNFGVGVTSVDNWQDTIYLDNRATSGNTLLFFLRVFYIPVADPGFEEGGFQVCGQSPHGCRRQLPHKQPMLGESGGMPPQKIFCKMDALRRVFLHSGAILGAHIAEQKNPSFSVVLYN